MTFFFFNGEKMNASLILLFIWWEGIIEIYNTSQNNFIASFSALDLDAVEMLDNLFLKKSTNLRLPWPVSTCFLANIHTLCWPRMVTELLSEDKGSIVKLLES